MIYRYILFVLFLATVVAVAVSANRVPLAQDGIVFAQKKGEDRSSIIKFSHKFHIEEAGIECAACHAAATTSKFSSDNLLPVKADCAGCHDVQEPQECLKCHVDEQRLVPFDSPVREIIFPHAAHAVEQNMACETCHAGLEKVDFATAANMPTMMLCNTCHNDRQVTNTCESCHTNFISLIPEDHKRSDFLRSHRDVVRLGALEATCQTCHSEPFCQQCHEGSGLKAFGRRDLMADPGPKRTTRDSPRQTILQNVHELNYRFTHGIDAKARLSECASCHTVQTFCAECHAAGGNITQARFKPSNHSVPGFVTIGRQSGGGFHAEEARRDIENCMSCHDVQGRDPSCMMCHAEDGRVR